MIKMDHVTFTYGENNEHSAGIQDIDLTIEDGQVVVLCGETWVNGVKVSEQPLYDTAKIVGSVFQNPRSQFFNVDTTSEITFGCENLGMPKQEIKDRLQETI